MQPPSEPSFSGAETPATEDLRTRTEQYAREEPLQAIGIAFGAGLFLTFFPVAAVIAGILRLTLTLVRPALVVLGAVKVYEELSKRQHS